jgi:toxin HigB-1
MIKSFKHKELAELWRTHKSKIDVRLHKRVLIRLNTLNAAKEIKELQIQGYNFHSLNGFEPTRYTIHINGPWCLTFEFSNGEARKVDFEQYH